jgi:hypothetical protein
MTDDIKEAKYDLSPFQSHYFQAIYDLEGKDAQTEMDIKFNEIDFDRLKTFAIFPRAGCPLLVALLVDCEPGFRLIYRKEGVMHMGPDPMNPGRLVPSQGAYTYILGLVEDDGTEELKLTEKGEICSLKAVDFAGGFRIILPPDGRLQVVGAYEVSQSEEEIGGSKVQFIQFSHKSEVS